MQPLTPRSQISKARNLLRTIPIRLLPLPLQLLPELIPSSSRRRLVLEPLRPRITFKIIIAEFDPVVLAHPFGALAHVI